VQGRAGRSTKSRTVYVCQSCGHRSPRWLGRCPGCDAWNTLIEEVEVRSKRPAKAGAAEVRRLAEVDAGQGPGRLSTRIGELDRVLGGGLVAGSTVLLGGDPGIGKSTLALQMAAGIAASGVRALYVCGEEAPAQIRARADRLGLAAGELLVLAATDTDSVRAALAETSPALAVIDSIQTVFTSAVESAPGSVSQLREASAELISAARERDTAMVLIGHVTKEGFLAGPRVLEHAVDTVLYFEGDRDHAFRILRAVKNRFGPANEIGVFEMRSDGLAEVDDPSKLFLGARQAEAPGSAVTCAMEGSRPMLVEVQALVAPSNPGSARRTTLGIDPARVAMLAAVMEKRMGLAMISHDIFVNTAGGVKVADPGADLAVIAALASSYLDRALPPATVILGEVGLTGEVRGLAQLGARVREASRLGFERAVVPAGSSERIERSKRPKLVEVATVAEAWERIANR
jgi:DNA repair protein RadA/Sms